MQSLLALPTGRVARRVIVLAGVVAVLAVLPLVFLTQLGFTLAFGVLLDTFLVRSIPVPALVLDNGPPVWWPSALANEGQQERPPAPGPGEPAPARATSPGRAAPTR